MCTTEVSGATLLSERIAAFHETAPNIHFQILAGDSTENRDRLEKNLVDMGIVREPFNLEPYDQIALRREPWGILCSRDHPLAAQHPETVPLACLGGGAPDAPGPAVPPGGHSQLAGAVSAPAERVLPV